MRWKQAALKTHEARGCFLAPLQLPAPVSGRGRHWAGFASPPRRSWSLHPCTGPGTPSAADARRGPGNQRAPARVTRASGPSSGSPASRNKDRQNPKDVQEESLNPSGEETHFFLEHKQGK